MRNRIKSALAIGVVVLAGLFGVTNPAQASTLDTSWCNGAGWICMSSAINGNGNKVHFTTTGINGGYSLYAAGSIMNNDAEWVSNRSAWTVTLFLGTNCDANTGTGTSNTVSVYANTGFNLSAYWANRPKSLASAANYFFADAPCANF